MEHSVSIYEIWGNKIPKKNNHKLCCYVNYQAKTFSSLFMGISSLYMVMEAVCKSGSNHSQSFQKKILHLSGDWQGVEAEAELKLFKKSGSCRILQIFQSFKTHDQTEERLSIQSPPLCGLLSNTSVALKSFLFNLFHFLSSSSFRFSAAT